MLTLSVIVVIIMMAMCCASVSDVSVSAVAMAVRRAHSTQRMRHVLTAGASKNVSNILWEKRIGKLEKIANNSGKVHIVIGDVEIFYKKDESPLKVVCKRKAHGGCSSGYEHLGSICSPQKRVFKKKYVGRCIPKVEAMKEVMNKNKYRKSEDGVPCNCISIEEDNVKELLQRTSFMAPDLPVLTPDGFGFNSDVGLYLKLGSRRMWSDKIELSKGVSIHCNLNPRIALFRVRHHTSSPFSHSSLFITLFPYHELHSHNNGIYHTHIHIIMYGDIHVFLYTLMDISHSTHRILVTCISMKS